MNIRNSVLFLLMSFALVSCGASSKKLSYLKDLVPEEEFQAEPSPTAVIHCGDRVVIQVSSTNSQLSAPFNERGGVSYDENGGITSNVSNNEDIQPGYLVDKRGDIDFPIIGKLHIDGMDLEEVKAMLEKRLKDDGYMNDPVVVIEIANFQISLLGEFNDGGLKNIEDNKCDLLQAVAIGNGFTTAAKLDEVLVIRHLGKGRHKTYRLDMYSKNIYNSPAFHLQQGDVIYVKPRGSKPTSEFDLSTRISTMCVSIVSLLTTIFLYVYVYGIRNYK